MAAPPGNGLSEARASGLWTSYDDANDLPRAVGENFSQLLSSLGAPSGVSFGAVAGSLPAGWPIW